MSLEEVAVHASHKFLIEVDKNISLTVGNPQGNLEQLRPHLSIIINTVKN
jgi:hypothetical protein